MIEVEEADHTVVERADPWEKAGSNDVPRSGTGCIRSLPIDRISDTRSTTRPMMLLLTSATTIALWSVLTAPWTPSLAARSITGMTEPQVHHSKNMRRCVGSGVAAAHPRISRIEVVLMQNYCSPR